MAKKVKKAAKKNVKAAKKSVKKAAKKAAETVNSQEHEGEPYTGQFVYDDNREESASESEGESE